MVGWWRDVLVAVGDHGAPPVPPPPARRCAPRRPGRRWRCARRCRCSCRAASSRWPRGTGAGACRGRRRWPRSTSSGSGRPRCAGRRRAAGRGRGGGRRATDGRRHGPDAGVAVGRPTVRATSPRRGRRRQRRRTTTAARGSRAAPGRRTSRRSTERRTATRPPRLGPTTRVTRVVRAMAATSAAALFSTGGWSGGRCGRPARGRSTRGGRPGRAPRASRGSRRTARAGPEPRARSCVLDLGQLALLVVIEHRCDGATIRGPALRPVIGPSRDDRRAQARASRTAAPAARARPAVWTRRRRSPSTTWASSTVAAG